MLQKIEALLFMVFCTETSKEKIFDIKNLICIYVIALTMS